MAIASHVVSAAFDQGAAGTTELVAAPAAGLRIVVHDVVIAMAAAGTAKLQKASTDLTGAMPLPAGGPQSLLPSSDAVLRGDSAQAINLVTATTAAKGVIFYSTESTS